MKYQTTAKAVKEGYPKVIRAGYCSLQNLLRNEAPVAYCKGVYGWNFDVYDIDGTAICTGYRGMPSNESKEDYNLIHEYDNKAEKATPEERRALLSEFIQKVTS
jgi:hypothetical protein